MKIEIYLPEDVAWQLKNMMQNYPNIGTTIEEYVVWCVDKYSSAL